MRNLKDIEFHEKQTITASVEARLKKPDNNAYDLSKLILMAGLLGNEALYSDAYNQMELKMVQTEGNLPGWVTAENRPGVLAWLHGRMGLAAYCMKSDGHILIANAAVEKEANNCTSSNKDFVAWARAYQAIGSPTKKYDAKRLIEAAGKSNVEVLWSWVMVIYAAAHQQDSKIYTAAWEELGENLGQRTITEGFTPKNDSQAWALAMLLSAAQLSGDAIKVEALRPLLRASIAHPETSAEDKMLAQLTFQLVKARVRLDARENSVIYSPYQYARGMFSSLVQGSQAALRSASISPTSSRK